MSLEIKPVTFPVTGVSRGVIDMTDIKATIATLDGPYTSADIYARYRSIATEAGRVPGSQSRLGRILDRLGYQTWRTATQRGWIIPAS